MSRLCNSTETANGHACGHLVDEANERCSAGHYSTPGRSPVQTMAREAHAPLAQFDVETIVATSHGSGDRGISRLPIDQQDLIERLRPAVGKVSRSLQESGWAGFDEHQVGEIAKRIAWTTPLKQMIDYGIWLADRRRETVKETDRVARGEPVSSRAVLEPLLPSSYSAQEIERRVADVFADWGEGFDGAAGAIERSLAAHAVCYTAGVGEMVEEIREHEVTCNVATALLLSHLRPAKGRSAAVLPLVSERQMTLGESVAHFFTFARLKCPMPPKHATQLRRLLHADEDYRLLFSDLANGDRRAAVALWHQVASLRRRGHTRLATELESYLLAHG